MRRTVWLAPLVVLVAACGGSASSGSAAKTTTVQKVVTEQQPASGNASSSAPVPSERPAGFDPGAIYKREAPGVVTVLSVFEGQSLGSLLGGHGGGGQQAGQGSGFVINADGEIATNAHVVTNGQGAQIKRAKEVYVQFADGNQVPAKIVGADPNVDVALIKVDPKGLTLRPLPLGDSVKGVEVGQPVAAIGSPFGEQQSLSVGVISGLDRTIDSLTQKFKIVGALQTDAAINHGNSGGPLLDSQGRVLGINAQIQSTGGGGEGVGFAVPVDSVKRSLDDLRKNGVARYAYLGVTTVSIYPQLATRFSLPVKQGAWVQDLQPGTPAAKSGLKAGGPGKTTFQFAPYQTGGDIITDVDGEPLTKSRDLSTVVGLHSPGDELSLAVVSSAGKKRTVKVRLGTRPGS